MISNWQYLKTVSVQSSMVSALMVSDSYLKILKRRKLFIIRDFFTVLVRVYIFSWMRAASFW